MNGAALRAPPCQALRQRELKVVQGQAVTVSGRERLDAAAERLRWCRSRRCGLYQDKRRYVSCSAPALARCAGRAQLTCLHSRVPATSLGRARSSTALNVVISVERQVNRVDDLTRAVWRCACTLDWCSTLPGHVCSAQGRAALAPGIHGQIILIVALHHRASHDHATAPDGASIHSGIKVTSLTRRLLSTDLVPSLDPPPDRVTRTMSR